MDPIAIIEGLQKAYGTTTTVEMGSFVVREDELNVLLILGILKLPSGVDTFAAVSLCAPPSLFKAYTRHWSSSNMDLRKIPYTIPHQYPL